MYDQIKKAIQDTLPEELKSKVVGSVLNINLAVDVLEVEFTLDSNDQKYTLQFKPNDKGGYTPNGDIESQSKKNKEAKSDELISFDAEAKYKELAEHCAKLEKACTEIKAKLDNKSEAKSDESMSKNKEAKSDEDMSKKYIEAKAKTNIPAHQIFKMANY